MTEPMPDGDRGRYVAEGHPAVSDPVLDPPSATADLLEAISAELHGFDTETLIAIADYRDSIQEGGWLQQMIRDYVEIWR